MTYVIIEHCIDVMDRSCVDVCPVDCIYEGDRKLYVNPAECIDCGACENACPVDAIWPADDVVPASRAHVADNADFFYTVLPGRDAAVGDPGGAALIGRVGADTALVAESP
jgi:NAD-dependent dihydropyrimidine dehydrogenase PreA subunit